MTRPPASPAPRSASASAAAPSSIEPTAAIPEELQFVWIGPPRDITALGGPQALSIIRFRDARFDYIFGGQGQEALNSTVSVSTDPGRIQLTSFNMTGGCQVGDVGTYAWSTSADGSGLTMTKVTDECLPRAEAVVGAWVRAACKEFGCLGNIDAGRHLTAFFELRGDPSALTGSWRMHYGQLAYTVPSGWANAVDDPNLYNIVRQEVYAEAASDSTRYPGIVLLPDVGVAAQDDGCSAKLEPGVGSSSAEIAARIGRIPSLRVGAATSIGIGGRSGTMMDLALADGWTRLCPDGTGVSVLRAGGDDWRMTARARWRLILVDIANGKTMAILIDSVDGSSGFDSLVSDAMPIVESFEFELPAS